MIIKSLVKTCSACPSQWEGFTDDDRPVYIRYRGDWFRFYIGAPGMSQEDLDILGTALIDIPNLTGDQWSGCMDNEDLFSLLKAHDIFYIPDEEFESQ